MKNIKDLDFNRMTQSAKKLKSELNLYKKQIGNHLSQGKRAYQPRQNSKNNNQVAELNEAINEAIQNIDEGIRDESAWKRLSLKLEAWEGDREYNNLAKKAANAIKKFIQYIDSQKGRDSMKIFKVNGKIIKAKDSIEAVKKYKDTKVVDFDRRILSQLEAIAKEGDKLIPENKKINELYYKDGNRNYYSWQKLKQEDPKKYELLQKVKESYDKKVEVLANKWNKIIETLPDKLREQNRVDNRILVTSDRITRLNRSLKNLESSKGYSEWDSYKPADSIKDEAQYMYIASPSQTSYINKAKQLGAKIGNLGGNITITTSLSNMSKIFDMSADEIKKAANKPMAAIRKVSDSLKDVNPIKGESKEEFLARFMNETAKEYPNEKQRYAVANSYWEKAKDSIHDLGEDMTSELVLRFCQKYNYYTYGDQIAYEKLLHNANKMSIYEIARNIAEHSMNYSEYFRGDVMTLANKIVKELRQFAQQNPQYKFNWKDSIKDAEDNALKKLIEEEKRAVQDYKRTIIESDNLSEIDLYTHILKEEIEHIRELEAKLNGEETVGETHDSFKYKKGDLKVGQKVKYGNLVSPILDLEWDDDYGYDVLIAKEDGTKIWVGEHVEKV